MDKLIFEPWIGPNYGNPPFGKLLIIGESHYIGDEEDYTESTDFTSKIVQGFINKEWDLAFFRNLGLLFDENDRYKIWKDVAFANAIQHGLNGSTSQPMKENIETIIPAFWLLIEKLTPSKILICSKRMWERWMPDNDERSTLISDIVESGKHSTVWKYRHSEGYSAAIGINHPSKFFSRNDWRPLVMKFVAGNWA